MRINRANHERDPGFPLESVSVSPLFSLLWYRFKWSAQIGREATFLKPFVCAFLSLDAGIDRILSDSPNPTSWRSASVTEVYEHLRRQDSVHTPGDIAVRNISASPYRKLPKFTSPIGHFKILRHPPKYFRVLGLKKISSLVSKPEKVGRSGEGPVSHLGEFVTTASRN
jgi:hypothetical protein